MDFAFLALKYRARPCVHSNCNGRLISRIAFISYKEKRKWLLTWSCIYTFSSAILTIVTYSRGPDSHEWYGCSVPLSLWSLFLFLSTLSYYTSDYMHRGQQEGDRERYVYDPKVPEQLCHKDVRGIALDHSPAMQLLSRGSEIPAGAYSFDISSRQGC